MTKKAITVKAQAGATLTSFLAHPVLTSPAVLKEDKLKNVFTHEMKRTEAFWPV